MAAAQPSDGLSPGAPGAVWRNHTSWTWFQWVSSLRKPCRTCIRRHGRLFPRSQGKAHPACQCSELPVPPGAAAPLAGASPATVFGRIPAPGQIDLVGQDVHRLYRAGLVKVTDLVGTPEHPWPLPTLAQLAASKRLTAAQLVAAGVDAGAAARAVGPLAGGAAGR